MRKARLLSTAVGGASIASHFGFSEILGSPGGYLPVAGMVLAAVSQASATGAEAREYSYVFP
ncbi:MAG: hypothetical protein ACQETJ_09725 [Bacteroidota bacterium]